jgi:ATP-dependent Clp protease protease subunit
MATDAAGPHEIGEQRAMIMSTIVSCSHLGLPEPFEKNAPPSLVREHLFAARTVLVFGEVNTALAESVSAQLLALAERGSEPIRIWIHSPGGHVEAGDTIFDIIRFIRAPVRILGTGWVASAAALIFAAAAPENRLALPNTRFLLHQPLGGVGGQASDVEIEARQILVMRERLNRTFARATGQTLEKVARDTERNYWMNAEEARAYGLVGRILHGVAELDAGP